MRKLNKEFIEKLLNKINEIYNCYYEEAPKNVKFPYGVVTKIPLSPLNPGYICIFDIELYTNELLGCDSIEEMCDSLRDGLDTTIINGDKFNAHLGFEDQDLNQSNEQDLISRRISFSARIFRK